MVGALHPSSPFDCSKLYLTQLRPCRTLEHVRTLTLPSVADHMNIHTKRTDQTIHSIAGDIAVLIQD